MIETARRIARGVYEHRPRELFVSVNGFIVGSQPVRSETSELSLSANVQEELAFVEILSEQGLRLAWLPVESLAEGPATAEASVALSEERTLTLSVDRSEAWPQIHLVYHDPGYATVQEIEWEPDTPVAAPVIERREESGAEPESGRRFGMPKLLGTPAPFWTRWRPAGAVALLTVAALIVQQVLAPPLSAAVLLERAADAERSLLSDPQTTLRRRLVLEQKDPESDVYEQVAQFDVWQEGSAGKSVWRAYDPAGLLVAGQWRKDGGEPAIYRKHLNAAWFGVTAPVGKTVTKLWFPDLSSVGFSGLVKDMDSATAEERDGSYIIRYQGALAGTVGEVLSVELALDRSTFRPLQQVWKVRQGKRILEYRVREERFDRFATSDVLPSVFNVDRELTSRAQVAPLVEPPPAPLAFSREELLELELDAFDLLDRAGATLGEQVSILRTAEGRIEIGGLIETAERRDAILESLGSLTQHPAVALRLRTVEEVLAEPGRSPNRPAVLHDVQVRGTQIPAAAVLREHLEDQDVPVEDGIRNYSSEVLELSRHAMSHAWAIRNLAERFSAEDRALLREESNRKYDTILHRHLAEFRRDARILREQLGPVFFGGAATGKDAVGISPSSSGSGHADLERLFELGSRMDHTLRMAFTVVHPENPPTALEDLGKLQNTLDEIERLAARLQKTR